MRTLLKKIIINLLSILIVSFLLPGLSYSGDPLTIVIAAFALAVANALLRPVLKALFMPLNVITFGLAGWGINILILYLITLIVPGFQIQPFSLTLLNTTYIVGPVVAVILVSFILSLTTTFISWVLT